MPHKFTLILSVLLLQLSSISSSASILSESPTTTPLTAVAARFKIEKSGGGPAESAPLQPGSPEAQCLDAQKREILNVGAVFDKAYGTRLVVELTKSVSKATGSASAPPLKIVAIHSERPEIFDDFETGGGVNAVLFIGMNGAGECKVVKSEQLKVFYNGTEGLDAQNKKFMDEYYEHCDCAR